MNAYLRTNVVLCIVLIAVQGFSLLGIISRGNHDFIYNIVGSTLFWIAYLVLEYIYRLKVNYYVRLAVIIAIMSDSFCGFYLNLYVTSPTFDRIQHIFGIFAVSLFFYSIMTYFMKTAIETRWIKFVFVAAIGMAVGSLNEIIEFAADTIMNPQILNQPSLEDTDLDLISNTIGAIFAGIFAAFSNLDNQ